MNYHLFAGREQFLQDVWGALKAWHSGKDKHLLTYLFLVKVVKESAAEEGRELLPRLAINQVLQDGINKLAEYNPKSANILGRYVEDKTARLSAVEINISLDQFNRLQRDAVKQLTDILWRCEDALRKEHIHKIEAQLPSPQASQLFGFDNAISDVEGQLISPEKIWIVAVVGIGGIGKTSLARAVVTKLIPLFHFEKFVWVRADPDLFENGRTKNNVLDVLLIELAKQICPAVPLSAPMKQRKQKLRQVLKETPHLVVIDNLETEASTSYLLEQLMGWANPSKFLLTTRTRPTGIEEVSTFPLEELGKEDAGDLLRYHVRILNVPDLPQATDGQVQLIYDAVGGNPLAIKLVVDLARLMPMSKILVDLTRSSNQAVEVMYRRIYQKIWLSLSPSQKQLLRVMPLVGEIGGKEGYVQHLSGLDDTQFWEAVRELGARSLLEIRGGAWEKLYGIHRLTTTFLQTDINRWVEKDIEVDDDKE